MWCTFSRYSGSVDVNTFRASVPAVFRLTISSIPGLAPFRIQAAVIDGKKIGQLLTAKDRHPRLDKVDDPVVPTWSGEACDPVGVPAFGEIGWLSNPEPHSFRDVERIVDLGFIIRHQNVVGENAPASLFIGRHRLSTFSPIPQQLHACRPHRIRGE